MTYLRSFFQPARPHVPLSPLSLPLSLSLSLSRSLALSLSRSLALSLSRSLALSLSRSLALSLSLSLARCLYYSVVLSFSFCPTGCVNVICACAAIFFAVYRRSSLPSCVGILICACMDAHAQQSRTHTHIIRIPTYPSIYTSDAWAYAFAHTYVHVHRHARTQICTNNMHV